MIERLSDRLTPFKKYTVEVILICIALIITIFAFAQSSISQSQASVEFSENVLGTSIESVSASPVPSPVDVYIAVDVSGAVLEPDVYKLKVGARLGEAIDMAGGLASTADRLFVSRNYNFARKLSDQEKIYIPYYSDTSSGIFVEEPRILDYLQPLGSQNESTEMSVSPSDETVSINSASLSQLDTLPGVGPVTAQKIIDNRPYESVDDLLLKQVVKVSVFEDIESMLSL